MRAGRPLHSVRITLCNCMFMIMRNWLIVNCCSWIYPHRMPDSCGSTSLYFQHLGVATSLIVWMKRELIQFMSQIDSTSSLWSCWILNLHDGRFYGNQRWWFGWFPIGVAANTHTYTHTHKHEHEHEHEHEHGHTYLKMWSRILSR